MYLSELFVMLPEGLLIELLLRAILLLRAAMAKFLRRAIFDMTAGSYGES